MLGDYGPVPVVNSVEDDINDGFELTNIKPYLRPMSSMTREEGDELFQLMGNGCDSQRVDFYNSHYLDYRGLIEKDLALEAPEGIYKFE
jgi:hypothetical protein